MRIAAVEPFCLRLPGATGPDSDLFLVRVRSACGRAGWGEATAAPLVCLAATVDPERGLAGLLQGEPLDEPGDARRLHEKLLRDGPGVLPALGAVDVALWDLLGRGLDRPVWNLLDGAGAAPREAGPAEPGALEVAAQGGLTPLHRLRRAAQEGGAPFFVRAAGSAIGLAAALHLLAGAPGFGSLEDASGRNTLAAMLADPRPAPGADGRFPVPPGPGLGVVPDPGVLRLNVHSVRIERAARTLFDQPAP
jgi:L-alanine-DL-glutamate epimerase-like enolase superfamily enzyme